MNQLEEKKTILIIDEDQAICAAFNKVLGKEYHIISSNNFIDGLFALKMNKPELVIIDIKVPGEIEKLIIRQIKDFQSNLPIIIITAFTNYFNYQDIKSFDADDYIKKPINVDELLAKIKNIENMENASS